MSTEMKLTPVEAEATTEEWYEVQYSYGGVHWVASMGKYAIESAKREMATCIQRAKGPSELRPAYRIVHKRLTTTPMREATE
jgi:hypothetical protein